MITVLFYRYNIIKATQSYIHAKLAVGPYCDKEDSDILIPKIIFKPDSEKMPVKFMRKQFPVRPDFSITANRSQGGTYQKVGIYLKDELFGHGQTYVAISRVGSFKKVSVFKPKNSPSFGYMRNVVYQEILQKSRIMSSKGKNHVDPMDIMTRPMESKPTYPTFNPSKNLSFQLQKSLANKRLEEAGFQMGELTKGDGNCFIHALKYLIG